MTRLKRNGFPKRMAVQALMTAVLCAVPARAANDAGNPAGCLAFPLTRQITVGRTVVPTMVILRSSQQEFNGVIEAWVGDRNEAHVCRRPVAVGKGEFRFYLYPQAAEWSGESSLRVKLVEPGGQSGGVLEGVLRRVQGDWFVLSVMGQNRFFGTQELAPLRVVVNQVRQTETLPDQWHGYGMFDAVFWDGQVTTPLEPVQKKALADWVRSGGTLILGAKSGDLTARSPIPDLIPDLPLSETKDKKGQIVIRSLEMPGNPRERFAVREIGLGRVVFPRTDFGDVASWPEGDKRMLVSGQPARKGPPPHMAESPTLEEVLYPWREFQPLLARRAGYTALNFTPILITMLIYILGVGAGLRRVEAGEEAALDLGDIPGDDRSVLSLLVLLLL